MLQTKTSVIKNPSSSTNKQKKTKQVWEEEAIVQTHACNASDIGRVWSSLSMYTNSGAHI